jgi:hypothetical protein
MKIKSALVLLAITLASAASADTRGADQHTVIVYQQYTVSKALGVELLVEMGVGLLAFVLFAISVLAFIRDRRKKFLAISASFLIFTLKGVLGLADFMYPREIPLLQAFSDSLDFLILILLFIAVSKKD